MWFLYILLRGTLIYRRHHRLTDTTFWTRSLLHFQTGNVVTRGFEVRCQRIHYNNNEIQFAFFSRMCQEHFKQMPLQFIYVFMDRMKDLFGTRRGDDMRFKHICRFLQACTSRMNIHRRGRGVMATGDYSMFNACRGSWQFKDPMSVSST